MGKVDKQKVYIKKIWQISKHAVWLVDGACIRKELDENFVLYGGRHSYDFIPTYEFWIEDNSNPAEWYFFLHNLISEKAALAEELSSSIAEERALRLEQEERQKVQSIERSKYINAENEKLVRGVRRQLYDKYKGTVAVWLVDGMLVREVFTTDFKAGGHDRVYPFIPEYEIWLEEALSPEEKEFILVHELHERRLMGGGKDYPHAHMGATEVEDHYRNHPSEVAHRIREEMEKQ